MLQTTRHPTTVDRVYDQLHASIRILLRQVSENKVSETVFGNVQSALEALPLQTGEFGLCVTRLGNALRYVDHGELGAARYELLQLANSLQTLSCAR